MAVTRASPMGGQWREVVTRCDYTSTPHPQAPQVCPDSEGATTTMGVGDLARLPVGSATGNCVPCGSSSSSSCRSNQSIGHWTMADGSVQLKMTIWAPSFI
ncbi:hypothetical protein PG985_016182 [Apiospora marii]|uniref:uncharacterized protein n=1 Tax=Apiospora marii TaxID=335849 RepID=UPI00313089DB